MYAKLVLRNAKRSVKDYLVYIVTMTIDTKAKTCSFSGKLYQS